MKFLARILAFILTFSHFGFEIAPDVSSLTKELVALNKRIADIEANKTKLEKSLHALAKKIEDLKAKEQSFIVRAKLERMLKNASALSDQLELLELELQEANNMKTEISSKLADLCDKKMEFYANSVKVARTKSEAKRALEAYLAYHYLRDSWVTREVSETKEILIPSAHPSDSVAELKQKLLVIDDLDRMLEQLKEEAQRQLDNLLRERELEKEILKKAELRRMFEEGEIETFGSTPSVADLQRLEDDIKRIKSWLSYLERVKAELVSARSKIVARLGELAGELR